MENSTQSLRRLQPTGSHRQSQYLAGNASFAAKLSLKLQWALCFACLPTVYFQTVGAGFVYFGCEHFAAFFGYAAAAAAAAA